MKIAALLKPQGSGCNKDGRQLMKGSLVDMYFAFQEDNDVDGVKILKQGIRVADMPRNGGCTAIVDGASIDKHSEDRRYLSFYLGDLVIADAQAQQKYEAGVVGVKPLRQSYAEFLRSTGLDEETIAKKVRHLPLPNEPTVSESARRRFDSCVLLTEELMLALQSSVPAPNGMIMPSLYIDSDCLEDWQPGGSMPDSHLVITRLRYERASLFEKSMIDLARAKQVPNSERFRSCRVKGKVLEVKHDTRGRLVVAVEEAEGLQRVVEHDYPGCAEACVEVEEDVNVGDELATLIYAPKCNTLADVRQAVNAADRPGLWDVMVAEVIASHTVTVSLKDGTIKRLVPAALFDRNVVNFSFDDVWLDLMGVPRIQVIDCDSDNPTFENAGLLFRPCINRHYINWRRFGDGLAQILRGKAKKAPPVRRGGGGGVDLHIGAVDLGDMEALGNEVDQNAAESDAVADAVLHDDNEIAMLQALGVGPDDDVLSEVEIVTEAIVAEPVTDSVPDDQVSA